MSESLWGVAVDTGTWNAVNLQAALQGPAPQQARPPGQSRARAACAKQARPCCLLNACYSFPHVELSEEHKQMRKRRREG